MIKHLPGRDSYTAFSNYIFTRVKAGKITGDGLAVYVYLISKPEDWEIRVDEVARALSWSRPRVAKAMEELAQEGFAWLEPVRGKGGRLAGKRWNLAEVPWLNPTWDHRQPENQGVGESAKPTKQPTAEVELSTAKSTLTSELHRHAEKCCVGGSAFRNKKNGGCACTPSTAVALASELHRRAENEGVGDEAAIAVEYAKGAAERAPELNTERLTTEEAKENISELLRSSFGVCRTDQGALFELGEGLNGNRKKGPDLSKPVEEWTAAHFLAYVLSERRKLGRPLAVPKEAAGRHMKMLLDWAVGIFGEAAGRRALKMLIDAKKADPRFAGTGFLLHEAEKYWTAGYSRLMTVPDHLVTEETF